MAMPIGECSAPSFTKYCLCAVCIMYKRMITTKQGSNEVKLRGWHRSLPASN